MNLRCFRSVLLLLPVLANPLLAGTPDEDQAHIEEIRARFPKDYRSIPDKKEAVLTLHGWRREFATAVFDFAEQHPHDARRGEWIRQALSLRPLFVKGFKPDYATRPSIDNVILDPAAAAEWEKRGTALAQAAMNDNEIPEGTRAAIGATRLLELVRQFENGASSTSEIEAALTAFAARFPRSLSEIDGPAIRYLNALSEINSPGLSAALDRLPAMGTDKLREAAEAIRKKRAQIGLPIALAFTAVDGRPVDLVQLRGKVVLVDFWATWCGPCKAELPNVVANYKKYHDKGFEVVGIALENAHLADKDTPSQTTAKLDKARKALTDFTAANDMPWPQYFDGKFWKNEISTRFAINAIPAMFLLDQDGKVVTTSARGEKLEAEVKRLLGL